MLAKVFRFRANIFFDKEIQESCKNYLPFCFWSLDDCKGVSGANAVVSHFRPLVTGRESSGLSLEFNVKLENCQYLI
jgi:hypothetical protein